MSQSERINPCLIRQSLIRICSKWFLDLCVLQRPSTHKSIQVWINSDFDVFFQFRQFQYLLNSFNHFHQWQGAVNCVGKLMRRCIWPVESGKFFRIGPTCVGWPIFHIWKWTFWTRIWSRHNSRVFDSASAYISQFISVIVILIIGSVWKWTIFWASEWE